MDLGGIVVYDNAEAGKEARELCDRMQKFMGAEYKLKLHLWNITTLQTASAVQGVAESATWPAIVIVAVNGKQPLPECFKRWLCQCLRKSHSSVRAIAVCLHDMQPTKLESSHALMDLSEIAREAGIAFFSERAEMALNLALICIRLDLVE